MSFFLKNIQSKILYKILIDVITILLFIISIFFMSDFILKGIISSYISVGTLFILLIFFIITTIAISNVQRIDYETSKSSMKQKIIILIFITPFVFLSLKSFPVYLKILLMSISTFLIYIIINSLNLPNSDKSI